MKRKHVLSVALILLLGAMLHPAGAAGTVGPCPPLPGKHLPPAQVQTVVSQHFDQSPAVITFNPVLLLASVAGAGRHSCLPDGAAKPVSWSGVLPKGVTSGWQLGVVHNGYKGATNTYTSFVAVIRTAGRWKVIAESKAMFVPYVLPAQQPTGTPQQRAVMTTGMECASVNSAQATLPTDVGLRDAVTRKAHISALITKLRVAAAAVGKAAASAPGTAGATRIRAVQRAMANYADRLTTYLRVVPVATTATDAKTVEAFGGMINAQRRLTDKCALVIWAKG